MSASPLSEEQFLSRFTSSDAAGTFCHGLLLGIIHAQPLPLNRLIAKKNVAIALERLALNLHIPTTYHDRLLEAAVKSIDLMQ